jgi:CBS domain containing-hemolysin-like protein
LHWLGVIGHVSRLPLYRDDPGAVTGYILLSDILTAVAADDHDRRLCDLRREVLRVPETLSLRDLFRQLPHGRSA